MKKQFIILITSVILFSSCKSVLLGIKNPRKLSEQDILKAAIKYNIPVSDIYQMNYFFLYYSEMIENSGVAPSVIKDHMQPLQALYYNKSGSLQSYHINCNASTSIGGVNWNKNKVMSSFPPISQIATDTFFPLNRHLEFFKPIASTISFNREDYDYIIILYWNVFMKRPAKKLIHSVQKNISLAGDQKVKVIYVNNDNLYSGSSTFSFSSQDAERFQDILKMK